jgi:hypothetical protein
VRIVNALAPLTIAVCLKYYHVLACKISQDFSSKKILVVQNIIIKKDLGSKYLNRNLSIKKLHLNFEFFVKEKWTKKKQNHTNTYAM